MGIQRFLQMLQIRRRQRRLLRDIERSDIRYSDGDGKTLDDPVVITGAHSDAEGTFAAR